MVTGGKPNSNFSGKNPELSAMEATSSDAVSSAAATSTTPNQGGKPSSVSSPHQQPPLSASMMGKREIKQEIDGTPAAPSFTPSRHNSISSVANTPAEVRSMKISLFYYVCVCVCARTHYVYYYTTLQAHTHLSCPVCPLPLRVTWPSKGGRDKNRPPHCQCTSGLLAMVMVQPHGNQRTHFNSSSSMHT